MDMTLVSRLVTLPSKLSNPFRSPVRLFLFVSLAKLTHRLWSLLTRTLTHVSRYIFTQMFSPTIMLLIGGFTIAAALSKTRMDVIMATRILQLAGTRPSMVLLSQMGVATFASMWIRYVAQQLLIWFRPLSLSSLTQNLSPSFRWSPVTLRLQRFASP